MLNNFKKFYVSYLGGHPDNEKKTNGGCYTYFKNDHILLTSIQKKFCDIYIPYNKIIYVDVEGRHYYNIILKYVEERYGTLELILSLENIFSRKKNRSACIDFINTISLKQDLSIENKDILIHKLQPVTTGNSKFQFIFSDKSNYVLMMLYKNSGSISVPITISFLKTGISINKFINSSYDCENLYYINYENAKSIEINKIIDNSSSNFSGLSKKVSLHMIFLNNINEEKKIDIVSTSYSQAEIVYDNILFYLKNYLPAEKLIIKEDVQ